MARSWPTTWAGISVETGGTTIFRSARIWVPVGVLVGGVVLMVLLPHLPGRALRDAVRSLACGAFTVAGIGGVSAGRALLAEWRRHRGSSRSDR